MFKGNTLKKFVSLALVIVMAFSFVAPVYAETTAYSLGDVGYLAIGDEMTNGVGLDSPETESYFVQVAKYLYGEENWESEYAFKAGDKWRIEEVRYLLDESYKGDGYTKAVFSSYLNSALASERAKLQAAVASADYITLNVGINNFATYIIEQMMYYLENKGAVKYEYSFEDFKLDANDISLDEIQKMKDSVLDHLLAAIPEMANSADELAEDALNLIDFVTEVATYTYLSYIVNFNAVIREILNSNPDVELYVIGLYNPMQGETISVSLGEKSFTVGGKTVTTAAHSFTANVGYFFEALVEMANAYTQVLAPRAFEYAYVHPGNPSLLIDRMGNTALPEDDRIPSDLKTKLLQLADDTAADMVGEMFEEYGIHKTENELYDIAWDIFDCKSNVERQAYIRSLIDELVIEEILDKFKTELEKYAGTYGSIVVAKDDITVLLQDLNAAVDEAAREKVAEDFVVDLMTKAMIGQTFAGIEIKTQQDAYDAIDLLKRNSGGDPAALREAAAQMVIDEIGESNALGIVKADVIELLNRMDAATTEKGREDVVNDWLNGKAARKITEKVQEYIPSYKEEDAKELLADMDERADDDNEAIAENHLKEKFKPVLAEKLEAKYEDGGFTLQTVDSFDLFADKINNADDTDEVRDIVRTEIRAAAAQKIYDFVTDDSEGLPLWAPDDPATVEDEGISVDEILYVLARMDSKTTQAEKDQELHAWLVENLNGGIEPTGFYKDFFFDPVKNQFASAYASYSSAATTAEDTFVQYKESLAEAKSAFGEYDTLKGEAARTILEKYNTSYKGAGDTAQEYYTDYLALKEQAVNKVMDGYKDYQKAVEKGMDSADQLNETFDKVFDLLREVAEVETISLNDLLAVAKKVYNSGASYVADMVDNLIQGDDMAKEDKTVAYIALRYYLANALMIMPDANGHAVIADQVIKAMKGGDTDSFVGGLANRAVDATIDMYHAAKKYLKLPTNASGQVETLINPDNYVAFGDNVTAGTALASGVQTYPEILADALAMAEDDRDGADILYNYTLDGMRTEELWALVSNGYNGDAYTTGRYGEGYIAGLRNEYKANVADADVVTINVGLNNLTTYPVTQALLAANGEEPYAMDWGRYIGDDRYALINRAKNATFDFILKIVGKVENRVDDRIPELDKLYEGCEIAMNTFYTTIESMLYAMVGYAANLDNAVEDIAEMNENAVIVLTGFYDPMEDTYFNTGKTISVGDRSVTLPDRRVNVEAITHRMINQANRFLTNYVGAGTSAAEEGSRIVTAEILDTELFVTADDSVSKNLTALDSFATVSIRGHEITLKAPEYLLAVVDKKITSETGTVLHPNGNGHKYIADQILDALDFDIYADVIVDNKSVPVGTALADIEFTFTMDDKSTLYDELEVEFDCPTYQPVAGNYPIYAVIKNSGYEVKDSITVNGKVYPTLYAYTDESGYHEIDVEFGTLTVVSGKISKSMWTMSLDSVIYLNYYMNLEGFADDIDFAKQGGVIIWTGEDAPASSKLLTVNAENCKTVPSSMFYDDVYGWGVRTDEIFAKDIGDLVYIRPYVEVAEGVYVYQETNYKYSPARFCYDRLDNPKNGEVDEQERNICAALLEYATSAQKYFEQRDGYVPPYYVNEIPDDWNVAKDAYSSYNLAFDDGYLTEVDSDTDGLREMSATIEGDRKYVSLAPVSAGLDLLGAIRMDVYYSIDPAIVGDIDWEKSAILFWDADTYKDAKNNGGKLSVENCTYASPIIEDDGYYTGKSHHIVASHLGETLYYSCRIVMNDGVTVYRSGLTPNSPEKFAEGWLTNGKDDAEDAVCKALVVYGEKARIRFN
ncbi:MAG: hypothetical protein IJ412_05100 [Oscillospiraceae bacterium]|nr:hypothetical protein [Oscillospiraceae bacterium]